MKLESKMFLINRFKVKECNHAKCFKGTIWRIKN